MLSEYLQLTTSNSAHKDNEFTLNVKTLASIFLEVFNNHGAYIKPIATVQQDLSIKHDGFQRICGVKSTSMKQNSLRST